MHVFKVFLEKYIKAPYFRHSLTNYLKINERISNMDHKGLKCFSLVMGPFPPNADINNFAFTISKLESNGTVTKTFKYRRWRDKNKKRVGEF